MAAMAEFVSRDIFEAVGRLCAYYAHLEGAVAEAIWLELDLQRSDIGHPVTDRLQLRDSYNLLLDILRRARHEPVADHLRGLAKRLDPLVETRNLLVHGTIIFDLDRAGAASAG